LRLNQSVGKLTQFTLLRAGSAPVLFVFWMIFVGTFSKWELLVGAGAAALGGIAIHVVQHAEGSHFRARLQDLVQGAFVFWLFVQGAYEILFVAFRDLLGGRKAISAFRITKFEAGDESDPQDTARRVLAVAYTTMAPNFIVLGINTREKQLLFHQIQESSVPQMTKHLGAVA
jgi:multisubunit Na+/H+ antiporter MnhE subunit